MSGQNEEEFLAKFPIFTPDCIDDGLIKDFQSRILSFTVEEIGLGRSGGFDPALLMKKIIYLSIKSKLNKNLFVKIVKTFGIKFCVHGTRIKADNLVIIEGKTYTAMDVATLLEFRQSGKGTDASQITPTRLARIFATDAVEFCGTKGFSPPMLLQENLKVVGLPDNLHFLSAIYSVNSIAYKSQLIALAKNFDTMMSDLNNDFDKKNGFAVRFSWFFEHYPEYLKSQTEFERIIFGLGTQHQGENMESLAFMSIIVKIIMNKYLSQTDLSTIEITQLKANFNIHQKVYAEDYNKNLIATMYISNNGHWSKLDLK